LCLDNDLNILYNNTMAIHCLNIGDYD